MIDGLTKTGRNFADMAAAYIDLANTHGRDTDNEAVSIAFLHAAARYAAFVAALNSSDKAAMQASRAENLDNITAHFREYLEKHDSEYIDNIDTYIVKSK